MRDVLRKFSSWTPWAERRVLELSSPGVYLLARFARKPEGTKPALSPNVIYIGETCGQTLHSRLYQFNRSAFLAKLGHSGGATFAGTYRAKTEPKRLYVSVLGTKQHEPKASAYLRYVERALIWNYVQRHGALPKCNSK